MRYDVELDCKREGVKRIEIIEALNDDDAHNKAKAWARSLDIQLSHCWLIVKNADGRFKSFKPDEI